MTPPATPSRARRALLIALDVAAAAAIGLAVARGATTRWALFLGPFRVLPSHGHAATGIGALLLLVRLAIAPPPLPIRLVRRALAWIPPGAATVLGVFVAYSLFVQLYVMVTELLVLRTDGARYGRPWLEPMCWGWDASHYRTIAFEGYDPGPYAFFPLFPLLWRAVAVLIPDECWAAFAVTHVALLGGLAGVFLLTRHKLGERAARVAPVLLVASPCAFFFVAAYPESTFLCLAVWSFYFAERRSVWAAGAAGALCAATRLTGIALLLALPLVLLREDARAAGWRLAARRRLPLLLVPLGTLLFFSYNAVHAGDFWANFHSASGGWGRGLRLGVDSLWSAWLAFIAPTRGDPWLLLLTFYALLALATLPLVRRLVAAGELAYAVYVVGITLPGAITGLEAFGRYLAPAFPLVWIGATRWETRPTGVALALLVSAAIQAILLFLNTHGYWVT